MKSLIKLINYTKKWEITHRKQDKHWSILVIQNILNRHIMTNFNISSVIYTHLRTVETLGLINTKPGMC